MNINIRKRELESAKKNYDLKVKPSDITRTVKSIVDSILTSLNKTNNLTLKIATTTILNMLQNWSEQNVSSGILLNVLINKGKTYKYEILVSEDGFNIDKIKYCIDITISFEEEN